MISLLANLSKATPVQSQPACILAKSGKLSKNSAQERTKERIDKPTAAGHHASTPDKERCGMLDLFVTHDHYILAAIALFGTLGAAGLFLWLAHRSPAALVISRFRGLSPPFVNVVGVLFALTLAFLANDTWNAHDRAVTAVYHEAGALRSVRSLSAGLPESLRQELDRDIDLYIDAVTAGEWPQLANRTSSPAAAEALARLQAALAAPRVAQAVAPATHFQMLQQAMEARDAREQRIALSQTHVNPLKWLGMAFLGLLTMISIAMVYVDQPNAELLAVALFAAAAAPTAAIVLIQGTPFQPPGAASPAPLLALKPTLLPGSPAR